MGAITTDAVRIRLLGPVELGVDDHGLGGPKQRLLLGVLALRAGEVVPGDTLIDVLWRSELPEDPQRSLQVHVSKLRRVLDATGIEAPIEHHAGGYLLRVDAAVVDVKRFEELVDEGLSLLDRDPAHAGEVLREALALCRGRPLGGLGDDPALQGEAARLEDLELRALEARIEADLATGRHEHVASELRGLTEQHPLRERLWGQLLVALHRSGRPGDALEAYERARRVLREQLGVDPSRPLQELHARVLRQDPGLDATDAGSSPDAGREPRTTRPGSVAILPFEVIGGSEQATFLALGLHNDLLTELAKIPQLSVISRTSVLGYRGTDRPIPSIARELGVGTVVEGTVQSAGRRFRVTIQVIDGLRDAHRWAESYDDELTTENLFAIQSELARDIAGALSTELAPAEVGADGSPTTSLQAYALTAAGRQQFDLRTEAGFVRAIECYEDAVRSDPAYADAWTGLADALVSMDAYGYGDRDEALRRAEVALGRALALAPGSPEARTSLGVLHVAHQDGPAALRELERAMAAGPSNADATNWHSWVSLLVGRAGPGLDSALRAAELDPRSAEAQAHVALAYAANGRPGEGVQAARHAGRLSPYPTAAFYEGLCLHELGRHEEARATLEPLTVGAADEVAVPWAGRGPEALLALSLIELGERDAATALLEVVEREGFPFAAGLVHLGLGRHDEAARAFAQVGRMDAWPCLAVHHYHQGLWRTPAGTGRYDELVRTARRSWRLDPGVPT